MTKEDIIIYLRVLLHKIVIFYKYYTIIKMSITSERQQKVIVINCLEDSVRKEKIK